MQPLQFHTRHCGQLNEYHLGACGSKWLEKTMWKDKRGFYKTLLDGNEHRQSHFHTLFYNLAYSNCTYKENIFIYERLLWELLKDRFVYAIINFRAASFLSTNDFAFDKIDWEYGVEYQVSEDWKETIFQDNGFVKAKTGWINPPTPRWNNDEENKTALFRLSTFEQLIRAIHTGILDDSFSMNFFCFNSDEKENLIRTLQSSERPSLERILNERDLFITLFLGSDDGCQDYVLIKSKADITNEMDELTSKLNKGGRMYEAGLGSVKSFDDLVRLIRRCFGLNVGSGRLKKLSGDDS